MKTTQRELHNVIQLGRIPAGNQPLLALVCFSAALFLSAPVPAADLGGLLKGVAREATERAANAATQRVDKSLKKVARPSEDKRAASMPVSQSAAAPQPVSPLAVRTSAPAPSVDRAALANVVYTTVAMSDSFSYPRSSARPGKVCFVGCPVINNNGVVAFKADSGPGGGVAGDALFLGTPGKLQIISRRTIPLPGIEERPGDGLRSMLHLDDANNLVLQIGKTDQQSKPGRFNPTLWESRTGRPIFSQSDSEFAVVDFRMANGGRMCGNANVAKQDKGPRMPGKAAAAPGLRAVWVWQDGRLSIIAKQGDPASGLTAGMRLGASKGIRYQAPLINARGDVLFEFDVEGPGVTRESCLWLYRGGKVQLLARQNEKAPPLDETFTAFYLGHAALNAFGQVAFMAHTSSGLSIWHGEPGKLNLLVKNGDLLPGSSLPNSVRLLKEWPPALLDDGRVVLGRDELGQGEIWALKPGASELVFRPLDFDNSRSTSNIRDLAVRSSGMIASWTENGKALWAGEPGNFHCVVRVGQEIEVSPGDVRKVANVGWLSDNESGPNVPDRKGFDRLTGLPFNDRGQVVLHLSFDGVREKSDPAQGIIIATLPSRPPATLPAPSAAGGGSTGAARSESPANPSRDTAQPTTSRESRPLTSPSTRNSRRVKTCGMYSRSSPWRIRLVGRPDLGSP